MLPSTGPVHDAKRAQYDLEGGPGFAATDFFEFYAGEGAIYRQARDIVLVDMRGTGGSNPLRCAGIEELERRQPTAPLYPPALVAECAQQSSVASDPRQYTTAAASRDIELVRQALGYEQLDLNAISYGTTLALRYIDDFPARVHSAVLMGTVPGGPHTAAIPRARGAGFVRQAGGGLRCGQGLSTKGLATCARTSGMYSRTHWRWPSCPGRCSSKCCVTGFTHPRVALRSPGAIRN